MDGHTEPGSRGGDDGPLAVVDRLVRDLVPVRRLRSPVMRLGWWLPGALAVIAYGIVAPRPDLAAHLLRPGFVLDIVGLGLIGVGVALLTLRGAVPELAPGGAARAAAIALLAAAALAALRQPPDADVTLRVFLGTGIGCGAATMLLAVVPGALLVAAVRRGACVTPGWTGALAGGAGFVTAALAMRLHCPLDAGLHLLAWHGLPVVLAVAAGAVVGRRVLRV